MSDVSWFSSVDSRHPDTVQTTTLHHILNFEGSVHTLFEVIDRRNYQYHELQSHLAPTSRRCCITHFSIATIHQGFANPVLCLLIPCT